MTYKEYKEARQKEFDELPIFFAFGEKQFAEAMKQRGLKSTDTQEVYSLGAGGYYLKKDADIIRTFFAKEDPLTELMNDVNFAESAFEYEMANHEYHINWQGDWDVCNCFGNCEYAEDKSAADYLRECGYSDLVINAFYNARRKFYKDAEENDWY